MVITMVVMLTTTKTMRERRATDDEDEEVWDSQTNGATVYLHGLAVAA